MDAITVTGRVVRTIFALAILGIMAVVLVGPLLAIVSAIFAVLLSVLAILIPFALIGLLVWVPYQIVSGDPAAAWRSICETTARVGRQTRTLLTRAVRVGRWGLHHGETLMVKASPMARSFAGGLSDLVGKVWMVLTQQVLPLLGAGLFKGGELLVTGVTALGTGIVRGLRMTSGIASEVIAGAGVGALLLAVANFGHDDMELRIALGGAVGALIGLVVGLARPRAETSQ